MSDQRLVNMALKRGYINPTQLEEAQREAKILADHGVERQISFILLDLGYLNDAQMGELRNSTSSSHNRALEVNGYVIEGRLGSGGMGDVFKARGLSGELVAVKIMPMKFAQDEEYLFRFHREVNVMTSLQHPNITGFLDAGDVDGRLFLIMELVDGLNLKEYIVKHNSMSEDDVLSLLEQMARALHFAQKECGIIHRDIKPANIIIGAPREGMSEPFCAKLCDFGLAKLASNRDAHEEGHLTQSGVAVGTPHYMSPEVATGEKHVDQRADIYGLAATAYHAITGSTMYAGRNSGIIMYQQATSRSTLRHWNNKQISPGMRALLEEMLDKDLFSRIQDWETVIDRVHQLRLKTRRHRVSDREKKPVTILRTLADVTSPTPSSSANLAVGPVPSPRRTLSKASMFIGALTVICIIVGLSLLFWVGNSRFQQKVTPNTFHSGLELAKKEIARQLWAGIPEPEAHLILEPGVYVGPIILDASCSMLRIYANGSGVIVIPADGTLSQPLIQCRSGVRNVHVHGLTLDRAGDVAISVEPNAEATFSALHVMNVEGTVMDIGGSATIRGMYAKYFSSGIKLRSGSQLVMSDSVLAGSGTHFTITQAHAQLSRCRFQQLGNQPTPSLLLANGGRLSLNTMVLSAPASEIAISLERMENVSLENVSVDAAVIGLRSHESRVTEVSGLTISAQKIGLYWSGPWELTWQWRGQSVKAPQPIFGEAVQGLPFEGNGADKLLLEKIPGIDGI